jgi:uncharacterized membrane protein
MADLTTTLLGFFRIIFGFLLVLFIPGFAISFLFYPKISDISKTIRIVLSCVISVGSTLCVLLFFDIFLGVNMKAVNITLILLFFSALVFIIWGIRQVFYLLMEKRKKRIDASKII